jgi:hypothetical protein
LELGFSIFSLVIYREHGKSLLCFKFCVFYNHSLLRLLNKFSIEVYHKKSPKKKNNKNVIFYFVIFFSSRGIPAGKRIAFAVFVENIKLFRKTTGRFLRLLAGRAIHQPNH